MVEVPRFRYEVPIRSIYIYTYIYINNSEMGWLVEIRVAKCKRGVGLVLWEWVQRVGVLMLELFSFSFLYFHLSCNSPFEPFPPWSIDHVISGKLRWAVRAA